MTEQNASPTPPGRRHIIRRPRLTRLLDETNARIILLVAPAGYGKTTLAREWLEQRNEPAAWYRATHASTDVAALAAGLAETINPFVSGSAARVRRVLQTIETPERHLGRLAASLAGELNRLPRDTTLVVDDYHLIAEAPHAETFIELVMPAANRVIVTTRRRPNWLSARAVLYGEAFELGAAPLTMTDSEARRVLREREGAQVSKLLELASGWPAAIGLAALTPSQALPADTVPDTLHDFFAEELFARAEGDLKLGLCLLSFIDAVTPAVLGHLDQALPPALFDRAVELGFLSPVRRETFEIHPLVRSFLKDKTVELNEEAFRKRATDLFYLLLKIGHWDDAFAIARGIADPRLVEPLLKEAMPALLADARLRTVREWTTYGRENRVESPVLDLAAAEIAFRDGSFARTEVLAGRAQRALDQKDPLRLRSLILAGTSAHLADRFEAAVPHWEEACALAAGTGEESTAVWGLFITSHNAERGDVKAILQRLGALRDGSADAELRLANANFHASCLLSDELHSPLTQLESAYGLLDEAENPNTKTGFLQSFAHGLMLHAQYERALEVVEIQLREALKHALDFVRPIALTTSAYARAGMREFSAAEAALEEAEEDARRFDDVHTVLNARAARARIAAALGNPHEALELLQANPSRPTTKSMHGEYLALRGLAFACAGQHDAAREAVGDASRITRALEARSIGKWALAVSAVARHAADAPAVVVAAVRSAIHSGHHDALILAYRSYPLVLDAFPRDAEAHRLADIMERANDGAVAASLRSTGTAANEGTLSRREQEVLDLVGQGLSNKEIGARLFITDLTVKAHVRHIFEKLGVRTRTQAALLAAARRHHAAADDTSRSE